MSRCLAVLLASALLATAAPAAAQGISMLNPIAPTYNLLGFVYASPKGEGWRELGTSTDSVRLIYAEQVADSQINARGDFTVQAFLIDDPTKVTDALRLVQLSMAQRIQEKGTDLVARSNIQQIATEVPTFEYELVAKTGEEEYHEDYFVALAPDKSQYLAAKLVTKDKDFRDLPYFKPLQDSLAALKFPGAQAAPAADSAASAEKASGAGADNEAQGSSSPSASAPVATPPAKSESQPASE